jgi:hypothetical protein
VKQLSAFYNFVMPELPGVPLALVDQHLLTVARDFCDRTSVWRDSFPDLYPMPGYSTLPLDLPEPRSRAAFVRLLDVRVGEQWLWSALEPRGTVSGTPQWPPGQPPFTIADTPMGLEITFDTEPVARVQLVGSMQPAIGATSLPDVLLNKHSEAIRTGVLSRLMRMVGKPWSNAEQAGLYGQTYDAECNLAAYQAARGNQRAQLRTRSTLI